MKRLMVTLTIVALGACASTSGSKQAGVGDADLGRLSSDQMAPVNDARQFQASAQDEKDRAKLRLEQAQHEIDLAKADQAKSAADAESAKAARKIADDSREPSDIQRAQDLATQAQLSKQSADLHMEYGKRLQDARQGEVDAADRRIELGNAKLEQAKLQALRDSNVPAAQKYDQAQLRSRVDEAQSKYEKALRKGQENDRQATALQQRWEDAQRQLQARRGGGNAG